MAPFEFRAWDGVSLMYSSGNFASLAAFFGHYHEQFYFDDNDTSHDVQFTQFTTLLDKNKNKIFGGDILFAEEAWGWMKGDGYLFKKFPKIISGYCEVVFEEGEFDFQWRRPITSHKDFFEGRFYRSVLYMRKPMNKGSHYYNEKTRKHDIVGDGITCTNVEVVGNIFETPWLLNSERDHERSVADVDQSGKESLQTK